MLELEREDWGADTSHRQWGVLGILMTIPGATLLFLGMPALGPLGPSKVLMVGGALLAVAGLALSAQALWPGRRVQRDDRG